MELTKKDYVTIHQAIHSNASDVKVNGKKYHVARRANGIKSVKIPGFGTFVEQNPDENTEYSKKAKSGDTITWIVKEASWELIVNDELINK
jgi:hypothetical protein